MHSVKRFLRDDMGLETVEYAIIVGLLVVSLIVILAAIGAWIQNRFDQLQSDVNA